MSCGKQKFNRDTDTPEINLQGMDIARNLYASRMKRLTNNPEDAEETYLTVGRYKVNFFVPDSAINEYLILEGKTKRIKQGDELKRVEFEKIDIVPTDKKIDGANVSKASMVINVIDNPIWLPAIIYGGLAVAGVSATWFLLDDVQEFTEESLIPLAGLGITALIFFMGLK